MGQIKLTISLVMIGLFTIALIGFAINFASDNNAPISVNQDTDISTLYSSAKGNISDFGDDSDDTYTSIIDTTIAPGSGTAPSTAPFAITPTNALGTAKNVLLVGYTKIFGSGQGFGVFITAFISIIVFMLGLYVYKTLRGNPD